MGPRGFWIALVIVLFYLIARPHVGTVWYMQEDYVEPGAGHAGVVSRSPTFLVSFRPRRDSPTRRLASSP